MTINLTMFRFERDGEKLGIRCEMDKSYDSWQELHSYEVMFTLYRYHRAGGYYLKETLNPAPGYVVIDGVWARNWLSRKEYQEMMRELYPEECREAEKLFIKEFFKT